MMMRNWFHSPKGLSIFFSGSFPGAPLLLFQSPPEPLSAPELEFALVGRIPDLHLGAATEIDAAVRFGDGFVFEQKFEIAVVFLRGEVEAFAVVDEDAIFHRPVGADVIHGARPMLGEFLFIHFKKESRILGAVTEPAFEILSVEEGDEAFRWFFDPVVSDGE